jgi:preprotein translocase subunit SecY
MRRTVEKPVKKNILLKRILLSLGILIFIRMGTFLPIPGVSPLEIEFFLERNSIARTFVNAFSGNNTFVIGIFSLNIFPYINASILIQVLTNIIPYLSKLQKEGGSEGKRIISRLTRLITFGWALIQSVTLSIYLTRVLMNWNIFLIFEIIIWLTTGSMIILWLSELITEYGLGNGPSLLIYINIVSSLPNISKKIVLENNEKLNFGSSLIILLLLLFAICGIIMLQESARLIPLISSKELSSLGVNSQKSNYIPLRFNQAGVMPIILTTGVLVIPTYINSLGFLPLISFPYLIQASQIIYWSSYFLLILGFSLIYSSIILNPKDISEQLQKMAVAIPGIRPGIVTTFYLKEIMRRVTILGAILLAFLATLPNIVEGILGISSLNGLGTTSLLILVGVILDTSREIRSLRISNIYTEMFD